MLLRFLCLSDVPCQSGKNRFVAEWNEGIFEGSALSCQLKESLNKPLNLGALSFGLFEHPTGLLELDRVRILKGSSAPHSSACPEFYAIR
jgi:hypothetical protein